MVKGVVQRSGLADLLGAPAQAGGFGAQAPTSLGTAFDPFIGDPQLPATRVQDLDLDPTNTSLAQSTGLADSPFNNPEIFSDMQAEIDELELRRQALQELRATTTLDPLTFNRQFGKIEADLNSSLRQARNDFRGKKLQTFQKNTQFQIDERKRAEKRERNPNPRLGPVANQIKKQQKQLLTFKGKAKTINTLVNDPSTQGTFGAFSTFGDLVGFIQRKGSRILGQDITTADRKNIIRLKNEIEKFALEQIRAETGASRAFKEMQHLAKVFIAGNISLPEFQQRWAAAQRAAEVEAAINEKALKDDKLPDYAEVDKLIGEVPLTRAEEPTEQQIRQQLEGVGIAPSGFGGGTAASKGNPKFEGVSTEEIRRRLNAL